MFRVEKFEFKIVRKDETFNLKFCTVSVLFLYQHYSVLLLLLLVLLPSWK